MSFPVKELTAENNFITGLKQIVDISELFKESGGLNLEDKRPIVDLVLSREVY